MNEGSPVCVKKAVAEAQETIVLLLGGDLSSRRRIREWLPAGFALVTAQNAFDAEEHLRKLDIGIVICEERLDAHDSGLVLLADLHARHPTMQPVLLSNALDESLFEFALNEAGVAAYLRKPLSEANVSRVLETAAALHRDALGVQVWRERHRRRTRGPRRILNWPRALQRNSRMLMRYARDVTLTSGAIIIGMQLLFLVLGGLVFFALYFLKSLLGINLLQDLHLQDLLSG